MNKVAAWGSAGVFVLIPLLGIMGILSNLQPAVIQASPPAPTLTNRIATPSPAPTATTVPSPRTKSRVIQAHGQGRNSVELVSQNKPSTARTTAPATAPTTVPTPPTPPTVRRPAGSTPTSSPSPSNSSVASACLYLVLGVCLDI